MDAIYGTGLMPAGFFLHENGLRIINGCYIRSGTHTRRIFSKVNCMRRLYMGVLSQDSENYLRFPHNFVGIVYPYKGGIKTHSKLYPLNFYLRIIYGCYILNGTQSSPDFSSVKLFKDNLRMLHKERFSFTAYYLLILISRLIMVLLK